MNNCLCNLFEGNNDWLWIIIILFLVWILACNNHGHNGCGC